jgi:hypothetical protein
LTNVGAPAAGTSVEHSGHRLFISTLGLADAAATLVRDALAEGQRPVVVHPGAVVGAAIEVACEARGISLHDVVLIHTAAGQHELDRAASAMGGADTHLILTCGDAHCPAFGSADTARTCVVSMAESPGAAEVVRSIRAHDTLDLDGARLDISQPAGELLALALLADSPTNGDEELFNLAASGLADAGVVELLRSHHAQHSANARSAAALRGRLEESEREHRSLRSRLELAANIGARLLQADGDLGRLLTLAATGCGRPVLLEDPSFRPLRWSSEPRPPPPPLSERWSPRRTTELARRMEAGHPQLVQLGMPRDGYRLVMRIGQQRAVGYLSICDVGPRDAELAIWLQQLAIPVTVAMVYEEETTRIAANLQTQVVQMLLLGHLGQGEATAAARRLGWPAAGCRTAVAVLARADDGGRSLGVRNRQLSAAMRAAGRVDLPAALIGDALVFIAESAEQVSAVLRSAELHGDTVAVGIGTTVGDPPDIARSYREAVWAARMALGQRMSVVDFADSGLHRLFLPGREGGDPDFERPVAELEQAAEQCNFDPIETLAAFLDAGGNASRAAANLHLHLNSLRYRLQRISEICGVDLADPETRFRLQLALRLRRTRRTLGEAVPELFR